MIIKTYTKLCFYLYDLLGGQSGTERLMVVIMDQIFNGYLIIIIINNLYDYEIIQL